MNMNVALNALFAAVKVCLKYNIKVESSSRTFRIILRWFQNFDHHGSKTSTL